MRKLLTVLAMAALAVAATTVASADSHFVDSAFDARLSGENEVPAVSTEGSGYVVVEVAEDGASIDYRLYATGMADVTMAHIHVGAEGENGPRSEEHTSELQSRENLVCRLLLEKKN